MKNYRRKYMKNNILNRKVCGMGGFFLLTVVMLIAAIFVVVLNLARDSTIIAICDNFSHIVATKMAIHCYNTGIEDFDYTKSYVPEIEILDLYGDKYYPLQDFNKLMNDYNLNYISEPANKCIGSWDSTRNIATFQPGPMVTYYKSGVLFKTKNQIVSHIQQAIIENE